MLWRRSEVTLTSAILGGPKWWVQLPGIPGQQKQHRQSFLGPVSLDRVHAGIGVRGGEAGVPESDSGYVCVRLYANSQECVSISKSTLR